jgi:hypothetical protein
VTSEQAQRAEAQAQLQRARALAEAAALPMDEQRIAALARRLPAPSPLDRYDFGETEPPVGLRIAGEQPGEPDGGG